MQLSNFPAAFQIPHFNLILKKYVYQEFNRFTIQMKHGREEKNTRCVNEMN